MENSFATPILFLIFNRPEVTSKVFSQIRKIKPKYLYVAADGPRKDNPNDVVSCLETRKVIEEVDWECEIKTLFRNENLGCGLSVSSSISWFFEHVEVGIILEDDCFADISFFHFCSELLDKYKDDTGIYMISGTNLQNGIQRGDASYYFSNYPIIWGWASWRRAWHQYNFNMPEINQTFDSGKLDHAFQGKNEKVYWRNKLKNLATEKIKSTWDYQWFYAIWKNKGLTIVPNTNLVINIGFVNNGTHTFLLDSRRERASFNSIQFPLLHPVKIIDRMADKYTFKNAFSHSISRIFRLIKENGIRSIWKYSISKLSNKA